MSEQPSNVVAALARVTAELGGIEKLSPEERRKRGLGGGDERGVSYAYRGIDQIAAAAAPLFGKYGVVVVPNVLHREVKDLTINGKPWTDTALDVEWTVYGPGGLEDRIVSVTCGLGRDNSDKGPNKALTQSYKNLLLRVLCIGDPADDADGHTHEADARPVAKPVHPDVQQLVELMNGIADAEVRKAVKSEFMATFGKPADFDLDRLDEAELFIVETVQDLTSDDLDRTASTPPHVGEGGEGVSNPPVDPPAPSGPVTKPATNKPSAAARAALAGEKAALGAVRSNDAPDSLALASEAFDAEVVG